MSERKWINEHPGIIILITAVSLLVCLTTFVVPLLRERNAKYAQANKVGENRFSAEDSNSAVIGKLVFEKIPLMVRDTSGSIRPLQRRGRTIKCGDYLDVMWSSKAVLFMKEKGLFEQVLATKHPYLSDLEWDGQNIWVSIPKEGIWILDTSGQIVAKIGPENGLPPAERGLLLHFIEAGRMFAVGSFGRFGRGWCAVVEFKNTEASVNVFHEAKRVPVKTDDKKEVERDPFVVFKPYWIREGQREGRRTLFIRRCEKKYSRHPLIYPLKVDLDTLDVSIASHKTMPSGPWRRGIEYNGKVYIPGRVWDCVDPKKRRREKLVTRGRLPDPYGSLGGYWVSAHYGLVGWAGNIELYQIRVTDEEHDIIKASPATKDEYYHTFAFEDANGSPFKFRGVDTVNLAIDRKDKPTLNYKYIPSRPGYFPPGTYKVWGTTFNNMGRKIKLCEFKPVKVTENSPVPLTFKISKSIPVESIMGGRPWLYSKAKSREAKGGREILYCGQVVNAITGKPMVGAFVMGGFKSNLAWLTSEEWKELHKLPTNPSLGHEALWPIRNISPFKPKRIVRTDSNGLFEMRFGYRDLIHEVVAFEENYFSSARRPGRAVNGRVELPPMSLLPAAKVVVEPHVECRNIWLRFIPEGDAGYNGPRLSSRLEGYLRQPCHVPTGTKLKVKFSIPYEDQWCIPDIPQTISLKQGETLDLGRFVFEPAIKVFVKVVDSAGEPVKGLPTTRWFDDPYHHVEARSTNENGKIAFNVEPNSEVAFTVYRDRKTWQVLKTVTFKIGGRDDEGKEFILKL
jgi:hypothetical protein